MNYQSLLNATYSDMLNCDISEMEHYRNIGDNLVALLKENKVTFNMGNEVENYVWQNSLDNNLTEIEFEMVRIIYFEYIRRGFDMVSAFDNAMLEVLGGMDK